MPLRAGVIYFLAVFAAGFVLGVLRVSFVAPAIGPVRAVALELPIMLAVSWLTCGWLVRRFGIGSVGSAAAMGGVAFALLVAAETALALTLGRSSIEQALWSYATPEGFLGLAGQVAFGLFPLMRRERAG